MVLVLQAQVKTRLQLFGALVLVGLTRNIYHANFTLQLETEPSSRDRIAEFILRDHPYYISCLAWSLDDSILSTSADHLILLWNTKVNLKFLCLALRYS
jgi:WD40 repeat protein